MKKSMVSMVAVVVVMLVIPVNAAYYIAGDFNGWNAAGQLMTDNGNGLYSATVTGLVPGSVHAFKITLDGTWDVAYPPADSWFYADDSGSVTITFNENLVSDGWEPNQYRIGLSTDPATWTIAGSFGPDGDPLFWNNANPEMAMTSLGNGFHRLTRTLSAGFYEFKPVVTGTWNSICWDGRSNDTANYSLTVTEAFEDVDFYVDSLGGVMALGSNINLSFLYQAQNPNPKNGDVVGTDFVTALSWTNPDPNNPADTITCDVYFLDAGTSALTSDPNMGPDVTDPGVVQIADDTAAETVTLPGSVLPLIDDHYYYWAVHPTDPHGDPNGNSMTTTGKIWYFLTGDTPVQPDKPVGQYMYLSQDDSAYDGGENNPDIRWFQVTASYTDDGKSPIADANLVNLNWGWDPANGERGVEMVSHTWIPGPGIHTSGTVTAVYKTHYAEGDPSNTTDLPGHWEIRLEVTDGTGTAQGSAGVHQIYETCGEAAAADPDDPFDGRYDTNNDCIVNLPDFADFADKWLYQGIKYE